MTNFLPTATKIAWRELHASWLKFAFVVLAVATGVGALTGLRGFSIGFGSMLLQEARQLMAADLSVRIFGLPSPEQQAALDKLVAQKVRYTQITETLTMASTSTHSNPLMVSIKAVDPAHYPYYGTVKLDPPGPLKLDADSIGVGDDVLLRLNAKLGDTVRLGGQDFRIAAVVLSEPDRMNGSSNFGPRVLLSRQGLERTGLIRIGSRSANRFLFKLPPQGLGVDQVKQDLKRAFPEGLTVDFREVNPNISRSIDRAIKFLSLVSLVALLVGALGVSTAMHAHLRQKLDGIAIMKSIGATSSRVILIYLVQTLGLGLAGSLIGLILGAGLQLVFPALIRQYFTVEPGVTWSWVALGQGLSVGLLASLLFTLPPLLRIRTIRPIVILRRDMADPKMPWWKKWAQARVALLVGLLILTGIGFIAGWLSDWRIGGYFAAGLAASIAVFSLIAWALLRLLRWFLRSASTRLPLSLRHGLANLYRPGNQATTILIALGLGVTFTLTIFFVQRSLIKQLAATAPPGMPNVFLIDITPALRDGVVDLVKNHPGTGGKIDITPAVSARITHLDDKPLAEAADLKGWARRFQFTRSVSFSRTRPEGFETIEGRWWDDGEERPYVAISEDAARILKLKPGATMTFNATGTSFRATVATVFRTEGFRMGAMSEFLFTPKTLEGLPSIYYGGVRLAPNQVAALQKATYDKFPTVTVINVADVLNIAQEIVDQAALVIRFLSVFAILAGVIVLASSVAGTRFARIREVVILKTLGGTRQKIAGIFSVEFLLIGAVAGLIGGLLATGFSSLVLRRIWETEMTFAIVPILITITGTALLANATGWLVSARILGQKPLEVLREE